MEIGNFEHYMKGMENYVVACGGHIGPNPYHDSSVEEINLSGIEENRKLRENRRPEPIDFLSDSRRIRSSIEELRGMIIDIKI